MFMIYVENFDGDIIRAVTWNGRKEDGIAKVRFDVAHKMTVKRIWAEPLKVTVSM